MDLSLLERTPDLVDWGSLSLITALIITSKGLELSGVFNRLAPRLVEGANGSSRRLLLLLLPTIALSSALAMNDTAMLVFIPLVVVLSELSGMDKARAVTLSAIAANVGSALTPIGNPQNIIIWREYGLSFLAFVRGMLPFVLIWLTLLLAFVILSPYETLSIRSLPPVAFRRDLFVVSTSLLALNIYLGETGRHELSIALTLLAFLLLERDVLLSFDWVLVLTFAFIFIDFNEFSALLLKAGFSLPTEGAGLVLASAGLSQLISNVPATVVFLGSKPAWLPLALGVNVGGTGTVVGSLANLIAVRIARVSLRDFHRYSIAYFAVSIALMIAILRI
ncbi:SLC13 family permease [Thermococcus gammatolerans]